MFKRRDIPPVLLLLLLIILVMLTLSQILVVHNGRYGRNVHNMRKLQLELREMDINLHSLMMQNVPSIELNRRLLQNEINAGRIASIIAQASKSTLPRRVSKGRRQGNDVLSAGNHGEDGGDITGVTARQGKHRRKAVKQTSTQQHANRATANETSPTTDLNHSFPRFKVFQGRDSKNASLLNSVHTSLTASSARLAEPKQTSSESISEHGAGSSVLLTGRGSQLRDYANISSVVWPQRGLDVSESSSLPPAPGKTGPLMGDVAAATAGRASSDGAADGQPPIQTLSAADSPSGRSDRSGAPPSSLLPASLVSKEKGTMSGRKGNSEKKAPFGINYCPSIPPNLSGRVFVNFDHRHNFTEREIVRQNPHIQPGGMSRPSACVARHRVAVIIPYRDRWEHLLILLSHLHPILERQQLDYRVFVVEQAGYDTFNKARIMNIAFVEALKQNNFQCFVFHDVDLVPEDDRNMYSCPMQPRHMSVAIDEMGYKLAYQELVGGVLNMRTEHFQRVNGYSNLYWGWGAEDDDMAYRIMHVGLKITRPPEAVARYKMVKHTKRKPADWRKRAKLLYTGTRRFQFDGLNSLQYKVVHIKKLPLFTHILVDIGKPPRGF